MKSTLKQLGYLIQRRPYALEKPVVLQFPVNDICNSQCQMCNIWQRKKTDSISTSELRRGLRNQLYSDVVAVGINGGEPTLRKDLAELTMVLYDELPSLRYISLITNGYRSEEVIARISEVGDIVRSRRGHLDVMVSLDGVGEVHDRVRGRPGNFSRAVTVLDFCRRSPAVGSVRIGCTIIRENVFGVHDLLDFARDRDVYVKYRVGIPHQRLYTSDLTTPYALDERETYHVTEFLEGLIQHYEPNFQQRFFYRSLVDQLIHGAPRKAGCDWQHRAATISSRGELLYCAVESKSLGRIQDADSCAIYFGNEPHLTEIRRSKCANCRHDYVGLPPKPQQLIALADSILRRTVGAGAFKRVSESALARGLWNSRDLRRRRAALHCLPALPVAEQDPRTPRITICGWYGTETLGDKAILGGVVQSLRDLIGRVPITVASLHPYVTRMTCLQMPEIGPVEVVPISTAIQMADTVDLLLFAGGPLMAVNEMTEICELFRRVRNGGGHTIVAGCGVGPLGSRQHTAMIVSLLELSSLRVYRDQASRDCAARLGIDVSKDLVAEDPAFTWLEGARVTAKGVYGSARPSLVLGLRDFPWREYAGRFSRRHRIEVQSRFETSVLSALLELAARHPTLVIRPVPMCTNHFGGDDRWFYRRLLLHARELRSRIEWSLLNAELAPHEYREVFAEASAALTMRYHSLVFAVSLGIPAVAIDYTLGRGKVVALANKHDVPVRSIESIDAEFLVQGIDSLLREPRGSRRQPTATLKSILAGPLARLLRNQAGA